jgi:transposase-like protein
MLNMGIIKVEVNLAEFTQTLDQFRRNRMRALDAITSDIRSAVSNTFNQLLNAEMEIFLGRPDQTDNKRNGYSQREYVLKGVGGVRVRMPIDRERKFASSIILAREQIDPRLKQDLAILHLAGLSTRMLSMISKRLLGVEISADTVSKSLEVVEEKALAWLERPLVEPYWALFIDGTNFRIQRRGSTEKEPSLVVLGLNSKNQMSILAITPGQKDNVFCWKAVFNDLKKRGLNPNEVCVGIMDGLSGLETAFKEEFPKAQTARCWVHALRNALAKTPKRLTESFKMLAHKVMYASGEDAAREAFAALKESMGQDAHGAVMCLEKDLDSLLVHYRFEKTLWRCLKTTNPIERVNRELKRRTKTMETLGERTLRIVSAFTALKLEYGWQKIPMDSPQLLELRYVKRNELESAMLALAQ